jgi:CRP/FNR family transcriptional regulator, cyclic AMP receptor protein
LASESDPAASPDTSRNEVIDFLGTVQLFAGIPPDELDELARVLLAVELQPGDHLWRQGEDVNGLHVIAEGLVQVSARLPGDREVDLATLGVGEVLGEIPLIDGGTRTATVRAIEPTTALFLGRADFTALVSRLHPTAFTIKRRIAAIACERLRRRYAALASSLGDGPTPAANADELSLDPAEDTFASVERPSLEYLRRLPFFRVFDPPQLMEILESGRLAFLPVRHVIVGEGSPAAACFVTLDGAVEEVIRRGDSAIRVGLAGPGRAFGYVGLIDGEPAPVTAATRERTLLLVVSQTQFGALFYGSTIGSYAFFEAVQRDLMTALRQADRPQARLASAAL